MKRYRPTRPYPRRQCDLFFRALERQQLAVTYSDVRLKTGYSKGIPPVTALATRFSRHIPLRIPLVSAAMDTVTGHELAIALAMVGGLGVIHKSMPPEEQAHEVERVKFRLNGFIARPICLHVDQIVADVLREKEERGFTFRSFPVLNADDTFVGVMTTTDFDFCRDHRQTIGEVMTHDPVTAPPSTDLRAAYRLMQQHKIKLLPIVARRRLRGLYTWTDVQRIVEGQFSSANVDQSGQLYAVAAVGTNLVDLEARVAVLVDAHVNGVVIDTAHGDSREVYVALAWVKSHYPELDVVVGNVSQTSSAQRLLAAGADGIKIGQGPGSICTTRIVAGIGRPQVTAVYWCAREAARYGVPVCADGGIEYSGDLSIAIGAGADSIMIGSLFAGTDEAPGEVMYYDGRRWKVYRGMGSLEAMAASPAARERYRRDPTAPLQKMVPEGISGRVPYRGPVADIIHQLLGGLTGGMGYVGAPDIPHLQRIADFDRITAAGTAESHPHGVKMTHEPPNYHR